MCVCVCMRMWLQFNGYRVSVWDDEKVLEKANGDDWTTVCMYAMPVSCTLENGENTRFSNIVCLFPPIGNSF